jgi:hypothetical protein
MWFQIRRGEIRRVQREWAGVERAETGSSRDIAETASNGGVDEVGYFGIGAAVRSVVG